MKKTLCILIVLCLCFGLAGCGGREKYTRTFYGYFDTVCTLTGYAVSQSAFDRAAEKTEALLGEYHRIFDGYNGYDGLNNLSYLNANAFDGAVKVPDALYELLSECAAEVDARADITMGSVFSLWYAFSEGNGALPLPDEAALTEAMAHTGFDKVILDPEAKTVRYTDADLCIDLGSCAKGYAAEKIAETIAKEMPSFLLSLGGNVVTGDKPADGRDCWNISIQDPDSSDALDLLKITGLAAVTSGDYQRYVELDGVRYHHIIDPATLYPARYMRSVTVVCGSSALADRLSTDFFLTEPEQAVREAEAMDGVEIYIVCTDGSILMTDGMKRYLKNGGAE